ncbi:MAG: Fasciclin domain protein [Candidatus Methanofastidiosum methylothiophilum]|uniref:Fasciclin domain protein n=1 Tax=Candidatus Methanofastidiosum methylothiophilum TaxID=1705564 RepID=A0A150J0I6_9EURY|nr:MAG: Fasciclin domain protein [Candidatus Methanofastidiosum methylthiophilus]KYC48382.1 MAG: Fasciclin domain protein [Candidatus Methanofastidiosum methylthiophilus]KYC50753.1 MAG: Fasciclin domain protein [Candidatus Methanofastidiosum methylthiophilus]
MKNIIETILDMGNFNTFVEAVKIASLKDFLTSTGPLTVFVPQDSAFASIDEEELNSLLKNNAKLEETLKFHIVSGKYTISDLIKIAEMKKEEKNKLTTLNGKEVALSPTILCFCANDLETVKLENSTVLMPDISCSNGILHVMDKVLIPK